MKSFNFRILVCDQTKGRWVVEKDLCLPEFLWCPGLYIYDSHSACQDVLELLSRTSKGEFSG